MNATFISTSAKQDKVWVHVLCSVLVTMLLFFIDEGAYNFDWMNSPGNWIAFLIYFIGLLFGQAIASVLLLANYKGKHKTLYACLLGIPVGLTLLLTWFWSIKKDQ